MNVNDLKKARAAIVRKKDFYCFLPGGEYYAEYERAVLAMEEERRKWGEELFSPAGLKMIFRR